MKRPKEYMSTEQIETRKHHATTNIIRSVVLMKRAVNALTFADNSLEGTKMIEMPGDIRNAKHYIVDALRTLEKYL